MKAQTMRAMGIRTFGGPEAIEAIPAEKPRPQRGEVIVRLRRAGVNFIDIYMRSGVYRKSDTYKTPLPMILGMEGAGIVEMVGDGVDGLSRGDRVAFALARGSYADFIAVPAWRLAPIPAGVTDDTAAAVMLQGVTAHYLSHSAYPIQPGDVCLVHAAAGGVGQILVQLAKLRGAEVIATVGSAEKANRARAHGADHTILYREEDFRERVLDITKGAGVAVVYDSVGRETIARSIRSLRRRGTCILYGASSGVVDSIEPLELAEAGSVFFSRPHLADYTASAAEIAGRTSDLFGWLASGRLRVAIDRRWPLEQAAEAHRALEARTTTGKLLLEVA